MRTIKNNQVKQLNLISYNWEGKKEGRKKKKKKKKQLSFVIVINQCFISDNKMNEEKKENLDEYLNKNEFSVYEIVNY